MTIPKTIEEALKEPRWRKAIDEEMLALQLNGTWDIVTRPEKKNSRVSLDFQRETRCKR